MSGRILWLTPDAGYSQGYQPYINKLIRDAGVYLPQVHFVSLAKEIGGHAGSLVTKKAGTEKKIVIRQEMGATVLNSLTTYCRRMQPKAIAVESESILGILTNSDTPESLDKFKGSLLQFYVDGTPIPVIVLPDHKLLPTVPMHSLIYSTMVEKLGRFAAGKQQQEPQFTWTAAENLEEAREIIAILSTRKFFSCDIETTGAGEHNAIISVIGFSAVMDDGQIRSFVIPFVNPQKVKSRHFSVEDEIEVRKLLAELLANDSVKIFFNGSYDTAYLFKDLMPVKNWLIDPMHMWHAMFAESRKTLAFVASMTCDHYTYWKDEGKGDQADLTSLHDSIIIKPRHVFVDYLRYNALDTYWTLLVAMKVSALLMARGTRDRRWLNNYHRQMMLVVGPAFEMSIRGIKVNEARQNVILVNNTKAYAESLKKLKVMTDNDHFNPNSPMQVSEFLFDVLGAEPVEAVGPEAKRQRAMKAAGKAIKPSTSKSALKRVGEQHPFFIIFISALKETKKYNKLARDFGQMQLWRGRFMTGLNPAGTETERFSSKKHPFWVGGNGQNITKSMREMLVADAGMVIAEFDYSQSDAVFVAHACRDPRYMQLMTSGRDAHNFHCAAIFKIDEEKIAAGHEAEEDWVDDPENGVRSITKRVVHGSNYLMYAKTMLATMGLKAVVAAAKFLGHADSHLWVEKQLIKFVDEVLQAGYFKLYPELTKWTANLGKLLAKNNNVLTCAGGFTRLFFGSPEDKATQRKVAAFFGQAGTAGNVNRALLNMYYKPEWVARRKDLGIRLHLQVHDSLVFQIKQENYLQAAQLIREEMETEIEFEGLRFYVRTDGKVGFSWGKGLTKIPKDGKLDALVAAENKIRSSYGESPLTL